MKTNLKQTFIPEIHNGLCQRWPWYLRIIWSLLKPKKSIGGADGKPYESTIWKNIKYLILK